MAVRTGEAAPEFDLAVTHDERVRLSDFRGRSNVLLVFHPFAFTPVCEDEARDLQENLRVVPRRGTEIVFVSCDSVRRPGRPGSGSSAPSTPSRPTSGRTARRRRRTASSTRRTGRRTAAPSSSTSDGTVDLVAREGARRAQDGDGPRLAGRARRDRRDARRSTSGATRARRGSSACTASGTTAGTSRRSPPRCRAIHVLAPDLLGHGHSPWEPPWDIGAHLDAIVETVGAREAVLVGHSFGGRLAFELAARAPKLVPKLVLLDPAILLPGHVALAAAENARERQVVRLVRRADRAPLRREPAPLRAARARRRGPRAHVDDGRRRARPLPLLPVRSRRRVRGDGLTAAALRGRPRPDAARARRALVPPVRPPARRTSRRARRPPRGGRRPGRAHGAVGRARGDGRGDRRLPRSASRRARRRPRRRSRRTLERRHVDPLDLGVQPSPRGPKSTVGMPAAASSAESAQNGTPTTSGSDPRIGAAHADDADDLRVLLDLERLARRERRARRPRSPGRRRPPRSRISRISSTRARRSRPGSSAARPGRRSAPGSSSTPGRPRSSDACTLPLPRYAIRGRLARSRRSSSSMPTRTRPIFAIASIPRCGREPCAARPIVSTSRCTKPRARRRPAAPSAR